jgi:hypothetical protein
MGDSRQRRSFAKGSPEPKRSAPPKRRTPYLAVPRFVRIAERQIDNAAEVKPLPPWLPEGTE